MKRLWLVSVLICSAWCMDARADSSVHAVYGEEQTTTVNKPYRGYVEAPDYPSEHSDPHTAKHNDYWAQHDQAARDQRAPVDSNEADRK